MAEITSSKRIYYSEYVANGVPFFRSKEIIERFNKQNTSTELFIKRERYEEVKLKFGAPQEGDILLTSVGTLGIPYLVRKEDEFYFKDGNLTWFRNIDFEAIDRRFLYFWITSVVGQQKLYEASIGSTQPALTIVGLKNINILLPPLPEQRAIAGVLSSLDDKIDLLHRQNKTLEGMAEALWRKMFVEEAGARWLIAKLGDICEIQNGYAFKSSAYQEYQPGFLEVLKMGHIQPGGGLRSDPKRDYVPMDIKLKRWILNKDDIVLAMTDMKDNVVILGNPALIDKDQTYVLNQRVAKIVLKDKSKLLNPYMLYLQMKDKDFIAELQSKANSGVQVNLTTEAIKGSDIIVPPYDVQVKASEGIVCFFNQFDLNTQQIRTFFRLRDTLLPKLMSGEVRVKL